VEETAGRTPELSLEDTFLRAVAGLPEEDVRAGVVAEALGYLQQGFDAHYAGGRATDDDVLVGDNAYALAVETIARLDEPRFVAVASRMIRDGAGRIAGGGAVSLQTWTPHLADLLDIISEEGEQRSEARIMTAARELRGRSSG
jgi:methylmalonyl-CoA mutase cobalamin-binding subunit